MKIEIKKSTSVTFFEKIRQEIRDSSMQTNPIIQFVHAVSPSFVELFAQI